MGKEVLAFHDRTGTADEALERMLAFVFALQYETRGRGVPVGKRPRGRPRKERPDG